MPMRTM